jgi:hypothetical protein
MEPVFIGAGLPEEGSMSTTLTEAMGKIHDILKPLQTEDRHKVINAALLLLGDVAPRETPSPVVTATSGPAARDPADGDDDLAGLSQQAKSWARRHKVTMEELSQYFHVGVGEAEVLEIPADGRNNKEQVVVCYIFQGLAAYLANGVSTFTDDEARKLCKQQGCFDATNHTKAYKQFGNRLHGHQKTGWELTKRGLDAAAELIKQPSESSS